MRYIIGLDLGTTNSAVAYVDTEKKHASIQLFSIPQLTVPGKVESLTTLPSFCYLLAAHEWQPGVLRLPWKEEKQTVVGQFAKMQGARIPTRLVQSAKSWLCNVAADRRDKILPVNAADWSQRLSPVEASAKYLIHLKEAWNASIAKGDPSAEFEEQEIILTVPASFDEVARTLTVEAARQAGLLHVTLLEEPQAAFYSWISQHEKNWKEIFQAGESILVCDIGGGTTDFSLIEIQEKDGELSFQRMAVGDHLLLGGDNMDAAIAHFLEQKLQKEGFAALESTQWLQLLAEARQAKEELLRQDVKASDSYTVVLQGSGSSVIKGSMTTSIQQQELESLLLNGFFGSHSLQEALHLKKSRGFRTVGLPYEDEPSIIKHLAHFLQQAGYLESGKRVHHLLFNGGTMKPDLFQQAMMNALTSWFSIAPSLLTSASLDLAVARGAAYYGRARRGQGVSIGGGLPRTYYIELDIKESSGQLVRKALTILPRGSEEGCLFQSEQVFSLRSNTPVAFHLLTSHVRLNDKEGELVEIDEQEMQRLPPIQTILRFGRKHGDSEGQIPVRLSVRLTAIGTLELWLDSQKTEHRWNLEFQLRSATGQDHSLMTATEKRQDETFDASYLQGAKQLLEELYQGSPLIKPNQIMEKLEEQLGLPRREWSLSVLRGLWDPLLKSAAQRKVSQEHESRWWNLVGFCLRPGFGFPLDDFRIKELWKIILSDLKSTKLLDCQIQNWICYRRIAGGLNKGQQLQLASELMAALFDKRSGLLNLKRKSDLYVYSEKIRALAAFERLELPLKIRLGNALIARISQGEAEAYDYWALARIGARHLVYGSAGQVVPRDICGKWVEQLLKLPVKDPVQHLFVLEQLARHTDHRELNLSDSLVSQLIAKYPEEDLKSRLLETRSLTQGEQDQLFGEQLPPGLIFEQ